MKTFLIVAAIMATVYSRVTERLPEDFYDESDESTTEAFREFTTEKLPESTTEEVPESTTEEVPESTTEELPESTTEELPESTTEEIPESTTEELPESTTEEIPESTTEELPESTTEELPESTTEEIPESTTEEIPESTTEEIPESTTEETNVTARFYKWRGQVIPREDMGCELCISFVQAARAIIDQGEPAIEKLAEDFCGELEMLAPVCMLVVHESLELVIEMLKKSASPEEICSAIQLC